MSSRYLEVDSTYRNRSIHPSPAQFVVETNLYSSYPKPQEAKEPVSDEIPIVYWKGSHFSKNLTFTSTNGIRLKPYVKVLPDSVEYSSSENDYLILDSLVHNSEGQGALHTERNYYYGATINVDTPVQSSRIIEYEYIGNNKCQIRTETNLVVDENSILQIVDPTTYYQKDVSDPLDPAYIFVPEGPHDVSFVGCKLVNTTSNIIYDITEHDHHKSMIKISNDYSTLGSSRGDYFHIRKEVSQVVFSKELNYFNDFGMSGANGRLDSYNAIGLDLSNPKLSNIKIGDLAHINRAPEVYTGVSHPSTKNTQVVLGAAASNEIGAYIGADVQIDMANPGHIHVSEVRKVTAYSAGIDSIILTSVGAAYTDAPIVTINHTGEGVGAQAVAHLLAAGITTTITVTSGGSGYLSIPDVEITGGGGTGATAVAVLTGQVVTSIVVTGVGSGYTSVPTVTITGKSGAGATATAALAATTVNNIEILDCGTGYHGPPPIVSFSGGGGGGGASATASVSEQILTFEPPCDNNMDDFVDIDVIVLCRPETRVIKKFVNNTFPSYTNFATAGPNDINLLNYTTPGVEGTDYIEDKNLSTVNGYYTGMYLAITDGISYFYGYITNHVVQRKMSGAKPFRNYITVDNDFIASFVVGTDSVIISSVIVEPSFNRNIYPKNENNEILDILKFSRDNYSMLSHKGLKWQGRRSPKNYIATLINLTLPNKELKNGKGGFIKDYPYLYVRFQNTLGFVSGDNSGIKTNDSFYSNNPNAEGMTFRVLIDDKSTDTNSKFVTLRPSDVYQTQIFNLDHNIDFAVFLPDGTLYETIMDDSETPKQPLKEVQISAMFSLTHIHDDEEYAQKYATVN